MGGQRRKLGVSKTNSGSQCPDCGTQEGFWALQGVCGLQGLPGPRQGGWGMAPMHSPGLLKEKAAEMVTAQLKLTSLRQVRSRPPHCPVILISPHS